ncbi:MAG TPA: DUF1697 domain-containing protein [Bacteroidia bacterium]|jgi:uncharacterized protein (DUF1697 family)|nr:DUF1697 domain-containing protein [Bacteroidia bacterium]
MKTYIALLRGINVSGQKMIKMAALQELFNALNLKNAKTYIQSGNVVFQYKGDDLAPLQKKVEKKIKDTFGFEVPVILVPADSIEGVLKNNPFIKKKDCDFDKLYFIFFNGTVDKAALDKISQGNYGTDEFAVKGNVIYLHLPNNYGNTKLNNNFFESKLKITASARNLKTLNALKAMAEEIQ